MGPMYLAVSPRIFGQDAPEVFGNAIGRDCIRPRGQRAPRTSRQECCQGAAAEFPLRWFMLTASASVWTLTV